MPRVRRATILFLLLLSDLLLGCQHPKVIKDRHGALPPPPSESLRAEIGPVVIAPALVLPNVQFRLTPASGAWSGLGRGAGYGATVGCSVLGWPALIGGPAIFLGAMGCLAGGLVGAISGGVYGAIAAESADTVEAAMTPIRNALTNSEIHTKVRDQVGQFITAHTTVPLVLSKESAQATSLKIDVVSIELDGLPPAVYGSSGERSSVGEINPTLRLVVTAEVRLISNTEETPYTATFQYWGQKMTFFEWASNEAQPVRDDIERATVSLAERIVDGVFLLYRSQ